MLLGSLSYVDGDGHLFVFSAIALISKYVTKGWKEVQVACADKENSEEVVKVLSYLEVVEKVKHSCDETEVINLIEEHKLEREQLLTDHLKSKQVRGFCLSNPINPHTIITLKLIETFKK